MTIEEAKAMSGTEYTHVFDSGDTVQAYVKIFDPARGLSCWSLSNTTDRGHVLEYKSKEESKEEAVCLTGIDLVRDPERINQALTALKEIRDTGKRVIHSKGGIFTGCPI